MRYVIRCIWPYQYSRSDVIQTTRGWELLYGTPNRPEVFENINLAYKRAEAHTGAQCKYEVEEYYQ